VPVGGWVGKFEIPVLLTAVSKQRHVAKSMVQAWLRPLSRVGENFSSENFWQKLNSKKVVPLGTSFAICKNGLKKKCFSCIFFKKLITQKIKRVIHKLNKNLKKYLEKNCQR
jgi:hypothetical protein